ncbi:hypothetical protein MHM582_1764 [Microbacterium sp. HM58-2]|nr:hypothetical protein MHM582_1764 [Microbacterium sp. HM58-2]
MSGVHRPSGELLRQGATVDVLHHEVLRPPPCELRVVERHDRRVVERSQQCGLALGASSAECGLVLPAEDLDGHGAAEDDILGPVHVSTAPGTQTIDQAIPPVEEGLGRGLLCHGHTSTPAPPGSAARRPRQTNPGRTLDVSA